MNYVQICISGINTVNFLSYRNGLLPSDTLGQAYMIKIKIEKISLPL